MADEESFRDSIATVDKEGKRVWVYPKKPKGMYYNIRTWLSFLYLGLLFGLPFIKVEGHPVFLFNVIDRKFILFGQIFWPQDFFIFGLGMVLFIVFIALFTLVFGRIFCGWMCPQTVFMELVFRKIEYWIEGDFTAQKALARQPWNTQKIVKKGSKWLIFYTISFIIANTFLAYIIGVDELFKIITDPVGQHLGGLASLVVFTTIFFLVFAWFREQVCIAVCPYGRLQGVLLDQDSIVMAYDYERGEPRGKFRKKEVRTIGDCIDCHQCVQVCPTGIDIRHGTQLECVNCTACIDACNNIMDSVGLPRDLIRYASETGVRTRELNRFTPRMKLYTGVMVALLSVLGYLLASRSDVGINVLRTPGLLYQEHKESHEVSNLYNYKLLNKTYKEKHLRFVAENFKGRINVVGGKELLVPKESYASGSMFIYLKDADVTKRKMPLKIAVYEDGRKIETITTTFLGPFNNF